jgi:hypothetical protein
MAYPYKTHQIQEILNAEKCLPADDTVELQSVGNGGKGRAFETRPELTDGGFVDMRYLGKAPISDDYSSYDASFLIANQRVRGVGYHEIGQQRFRFKKRIPKGWHLNVCDPNLPTDDPKQNIHHPLPEFSVTDFHHFIQQTAKMWKIDLGWEWESDLFS